MRSLALSVLLLALAVGIVRTIPENLWQKARRAVLLRGVDRAFADFTERFRSGAERMDAAFAFERLPTTQLARMPGNSTLESTEALAPVDFFSDVGDADPAEFAQWSLRDETSPPFPLMVRASGMPYAVLDELRGGDSLLFLRAIRGQPDLKGLRQSLLVLFDADDRKRLTVQRVNFAKLCLREKECAQLASEMSPGFDSKRFDEGDVVVVRLEPLTYPGLVLPMETLPMAADALVFAVPITIESYAFEDDGELQHRLVRRHHPAEGGSASEILIVDIPPDHAISFLRQRGTQLFGVALHRRAEILSQKHVRVIAFDIPDRSDAL